MGNSLVNQKQNKKAEHVINKTIGDGDIVTEQDPSEEESGNESDESDHEETSDHDEEHIVENSDHSLVDAPNSPEEEIAQKTPPFSSEAKNDKDYTCATKRETCLIQTSDFPYKKAKLINPVVRNKNIDRVKRQSLYNNADAIHLKGFLTYSHLRSPRHQMVQNTRKSIHKDIEQERGPSLHTQDYSSKFNMLHISDQEKVAHSRDPYLYHADSGRYSYSLPSNHEANFNNEPISHNSSSWPTLNTPASSFHTSLDRMNVLSDRRRRYVTVPEGQAVREDAIKQERCELYKQVLDKLNSHMSNSSTTYSNLQQNGW